MKSKLRTNCVQIRFTFLGNKICFSPFNVPLKGIHTYKMKINALSRAFCGSHLKVYTFEWFLNWLTWLNLLFSSFFFTKFPNWTAIATILAHLCRLWNVIELCHSSHTFHSRCKTERDSRPHFSHCSRIRILSQSTEICPDSALWGYLKKKRNNKNVRYLTWISACAARPRQTSTRNQHEGSERRRFCKYFLFTQDSWAKNIVYLIIPLTALRNWT